MQKKQIINSLEEPNREDLWFKEGFLKYCGPNGWKNIQYDPQALETIQHASLLNRDALNAHTIDSITGLRDTLTALSGGTTTLEHNVMTHRDAADSHPINAITGLTDVLVEKADRIAFSLLPYPNAIPTHVNQELKDSENRLYMSSGSTSNQDWDRVSSDAFDDIKSASDIQLKTLDTNLDFTVSQWLKCTATTLFESGTDKLSISDGNLVIFIGGVTTNIPIRELSFITYTCSNKALEVFINGISVHTDTLTDNALISYINKDGECSSFNSRVLNFTALADQVKEWYNGGRVNEFKLEEDYYKTGLSYENALNSQAKVDELDYVIRVTETYDAAENALKLVGTQINNNIAFGFLDHKNIFTNNRFYKIEFEIKSNVTTRDLRLPVMWKTVYKKDFAIDEYYNKYAKFEAIAYLDTTRLAYFYATMKSTQVGEEYYIKNLKITALNVLDEFIPSNVQPHKWINSGINATDIPLIAADNTVLAEPTKDKPYEEFGITDGAPSEIPSAILLERLDATNKVIYKSVGTDTAADWKQITNP